MMDSKHKQEYIQFLKIFGALSGLFKDAKEGIHAQKPFLHYRNHEQLYARVFPVQDLTRKDSAFDAVGKFGEERIGIGLKTWIYNQELSYQKVAEFNKLAPLEITPLITANKFEAAIKKIATLRNERIKLDQRQYGTTRDIYHYIVRDNHCMYVAESDYTLIQSNQLKLNKVNKRGLTLEFSDGLKHYKYYPSKSVLLERFDVSESSILDTIPIVQYDDPFELLQSLSLPTVDQKVMNQTIFLPLYSDRSQKVEVKSGLNAWNAAPKNKNTSLPRPDFEAYIPIPVWIHHTYPNFFGFNALDSANLKNNNNIILHLPDGRIVEAIITQANGKSLQTNPQNILGKWLLNEVLGLQARELLTMEHLIALGVDSLKITKLEEDRTFKIELAETNAFENWKQDNMGKIKEAQKLNGFQLPKISLED